MNPLLILYNFRNEDREEVLFRAGFETIARADMILIVEKEYFYVAKNRWGKDRVVIPIGLLGLVVANPVQHGSLL